MRVTFICGSLEPGRDGVGDYTRRIAGEFIRKGFQVIVIALYDKYISEYSRILQEVDGVKVPILRIPSSLAYYQRISCAQEIIKSFNPNWISLQYVPYAFNSYGLPLLLSFIIRNIVNSANVHIMVHEPYLGLPQKKIKNKLVRLGQQFSLHLLKRNLRPKLFHTTTQYYRVLLDRIAIKSEVLGLFGNINVNTIHSKTMNSVVDNEDCLTGVYFGSAPSVTNHSVFAYEIYKYCIQSKKKIKILICGRSGKLGEQFAECIKLATKGLCYVSVLGELRPDELSHLFSHADFGIARVSPKFLGKSGTVISMLEHGLPLWVPLGENEAVSDYFNFRSNLCFRKLGDIKGISRGEVKIDQLSIISNQLLDDLKNASF